MKTIEIEVDPEDPSSWPKGSMDHEMVDATTEADIDRHIAEDLEEEDKMWSKLAEEARKEGFIGVEESKKLIERIKNA